MKPLGENDERHNFHIDGQHLGEDMEIRRDVDIKVLDLAGKM